MCDRHIHTIMKESTQCCFFIHILKSPLKSGCSEIRSSVQTALMRVDWQGRLTLDPPWVSWELSTIVSTPVQGKTTMSQIEPLRCFVVGLVAHTHSSKHTHTQTVNTHPKQWAAIYAAAHKYTCTYKCQFVYCYSLFTCSFSFFLLSVFLSCHCHFVALR